MYPILGISCSICVVWTIYYLIKYIKNPNKGFIDINFNFSSLLSWYYLPCHTVWNFIVLTDPCCKQTSHIINIFPNGTSCDTKYIVILWNYFTYLIKRFAFFISTIIYYWFLLFFSLVWFLMKLFVNIYLNYKKPNPTIIKKNPNPDKIIPVNISISNNNTDNNKLGEGKVLKFGGEVLNSQGNQNSFNNLIQTNHNNSRNNYFEDANKKAQEKSITYRKNEDSIKINNYIENYDKLSEVKSKTDRPIKFSNNSINKNEGDAPPVQIISNHVDKNSYDSYDLPNESSIYQAK